VRSSNATRREVLAALAAFGAASIRAVAGPSPSIKFPRNDDVEYGRQSLLRGIRSRRIDNNNGVTLHILEAGFAPPARPCVVLLHGFPELG